MSRQQRATSDPDAGSTEYWRDVRQSHQEFRAKRRVTGAIALSDALVPFTDHNDGAHLIVGADQRYDFWPGTGRWSHRDSPAFGRGVDSLLRHIKGST